MYFNSTKRINNHKHFLIYLICTIYISGTITESNTLRSNHDNRLRVATRPPHQILRAVRIRRIQSTIWYFNVFLQKLWLNMYRIADEFGSLAQLFARLDLNLEKHVPFKCLQHNQMTRDYVHGHQPG